MAPEVQRLLTEVAAEVQALAERLDMNDSRRATTDAIAAHAACAPTACAHAGSERRGARFAIGALLTCLDLLGRVALAVRAAAVPQLAERARADA